MIQQQTIGSWDEITQAINSHQRFLISSHIRPDGDAVGSALAFKRLLEKLGKDVIWVMADDPGHQFFQFYHDHECVLFDPEMDFSDRDMMVMLDAGEWHRLGRVGDFMKSHPAENLCIDHHIFHNGFDGVRLVDTKSPSTTVLIYRLIREMGIDLTFDLAEPIYLGLIVDTQNFHLPNVTVESHHIAAECLEVGVVPCEVYEPIFGITRFSRLRLMSEALHTLETVCDGKVAVMHTSLKMFEDTKADFKDDDGFVDFVRTIEGVRVGIYLREENDHGIKVSWRSKDTNDISVSARKFGGGGHMRASGALIEGSLLDVRKIVIDDMAERTTQGEII